MRWARYLAIFLSLWASAAIAQNVVGSGVFGDVKAGGACTSTTLNPADKTAGAVLSNGNLTLTLPGGSGYEGARTIASHSSGKFYWELTASTISSSAASIVEGTANANQLLNNFVGNGLDGVGWAGDGNVYLNGTSIALIQGWAQGNTLSFALDIGNKTIWFRTNGGNWNNSGTANPATNTGGISIAALSSFTLFAAVQGENPVDVLTANFGCSFTQSVPAGFGNFNYLLRRDLGGPANDNDMRPVGIDIAA